MRARAPYRVSALYFYVAGTSSRSLSDIFFRVATLKIAISPGCHIIAEEIEK